MPTAIWRCWFGNSNKINHIFLSYQAMTFFTAPHWLIIANNNHTFYIHYTLHMNTLNMSPKETWSPSSSKSILIHLNILKYKAKGKRYITLSVNIVCKRTEYKRKWENCKFLKYFSNIDNSKKYRHLLIYLLHSY